MFILCQHCSTCSVSVVLALQCVVFFQDRFGYSASFVFPSIRVNLLSPLPPLKKKPPGSVVGIAWNPWMHLGRNAAFAIVSLATHECGTSLQLLRPPVTVVGNLL